MNTKEQSFFKRLFGFRNWRIPTKLLVVMLALSLIPLLIGIGFTTQSSSQTITQQTRINLSRLAFSTAERIEQFLIDNHNFIRMAANEPEVITFLSASTEEEQAELQSGVSGVVENLLSSDPAIDLVGFYDLEGIVLYHNNPDIIGRSYLFRDYVKSALSGEQFTSGIQVGWTTDTPGINASAPVVQEDEIIGAIATRIQGIFITNILRSTLEIESEDVSQEEREAIDIYLTNEYGIVVGHSDEESEWLYRSLGVIESQQTLQTIESVRLLGGACPLNLPDCDPSRKEVRLPTPIPAAEPLGDQLLAAMAVRESGSYRYCQPSDIDAPPSEGNTCEGTWHVVGYAPVRDPFRVDPETGEPSQLFMVVVDMPEEIFLESIRAQRIQGLMIGALMAALALVSSLLVARTLARPIGKLAEAAQKVEEDKPFDPEDIADVSAQGDEVGHLARVFSHMVMSLRARMAELQTIYEIGRRISESVDLQETLQDITNAIRGIIDFDAGEICLYEQRKQRVSCQLSVGKEPGFLRMECDETYPIDQGYIAYMFEKGKGMLVSDIEEFNRFTDYRMIPNRTWKDAQPRSYLGVPLRDSRGNFIGTIELVSRRADNFTEANRRILESIAIQAAIAIQNAREVQARENRLKREIQQLRIEIDEMKKERQVAEIVESDYFQTLRQKARNLRASTRESEEEEEE